MFVEQFHNKNQFVITDLDKRIVTFQSYESTIAEYDAKNKKLKLFADWDYSNTTRKHLYRFINEYTHIYIDESSKNKRKLILKYIKNGYITLN